MSLLDLASLVLSPTATKEGKVYSAIPDTGEGDMTFTRASSATRVNSAGLIEKARTNFLLQSNTFDVSASWVNTNTTETGGQTGYDGSSNAWLISKSSSSGFISQNISNSNVQTFSVYAKQGDSDWIGLVFIGGSNPRVYFNLANGTSGSLTGGAIVKDIQSVGNGWYRCSVTCNDTITSVRLYPAEGDGVVSGTSGSIYIQSAQLEQGLVSTHVITTTTSSVTVGITDNLPRVDYSGGGCPSLLLEPSRTNVFTQSEYFADWNISGAIATNTTISPEGVQNASTFTTSSAGEDLRDNTNVTGTYAFSVFVKLIDVGGVRLRIDAATDANAYFDLSDGSVYDSDGIIEADAINYGNNWWRVYMVANVTNTQKLQVFTTDGTTSYENGSVYLYGAMLEAGSYSTSYIPTYSVSSTRVADSCSKTGISSLINSQEGVIYWEGKSLNSNIPTYSYLLSLSDGTQNNRLELRQSGTEVQFLWRVGGVYQSQIITSGITITDNFKIALKYSDVKIELFFNGNSVNSISSPTLYASNTLNRLAFDNGSGGDKGQVKIKEIILFPTALTDEECIALTN